MIIRVINLTLIKISVSTRASNDKSDNLLLNIIIEFLSKGWEIFTNSNLTWEDKIKSFGKIIMGKFAQYCCS